MVSAGRFDCLDQLAEDKGFEPMSPLSRALA